MGSRYLTDLPAVVASTGLVYQLEPGWETRARGSGGYNSGAPNHVMVHHTASNPSSDGQQDVDYQCYYADNRPIANLYLSRSGKVWIMAAGATNTNGTCTDPCGYFPPDSGNSNSIGIEAANTGVGEPWPAIQQDAYVALVAALCSHYGIPTGRVHSHAEISPGRKIDAAGPSRWPPVNSSQTWDMDPFRADVFNATTPDPVPTPTPEDDDMPLSFFAYADGTGLILVTQDGAGTSILPMVSEDDRAQFAALFPQIGTAHVSMTMYQELYRLAGAGEAS